MFNGGGGVRRGVFGRLVGAVREPPLLRGCTGWLWWFEGRDVPHVRL